LLRDDPSNAFVGAGSVLDADPTHHHTAHHGSSAEETAQFWTMVPQSGMICLEASVDELIEVGQRYVVRIYRAFDIVLTVCACVAWIF
jgi:hypothetical protein